MFGTEFTGTLLISLIMGLCIVAGVGGGTAVVLLIMIFFKFKTKKSIAISGFSILLCSIARFILMINEKHPEKEAVAIDYGLATLIFPIVSVGNFIGVIFNVMAPPLLL